MIQNQEEGEMKKKTHVESNHFTASWFIWCYLSGCLRRHLDLHTHHPPTTTKRFLIRTKPQTLHTIFVQCRKSQHRSDNLKHFAKVGGLSVCVFAFHPNPKLTCHSVNIIIVLEWTRFPGYISLLKSSSFYDLLFVSRHRLFVVYIRTFVCVSKSSFFSLFCYFFHSLSLEANLFACTSWWIRLFGSVHTLLWNKSMNLWLFKEDVSPAERLVCE